MKKKNNKKTTEDVKPVSRPFTYNMPENMANYILENHNEKNEDPQKVLCDYVNSQFHLLGTCIKVQTTC